MPLPSGPAAWSAVAAVLVGSVGVTAIFLMEEDDRHDLASATTTSSGAGDQAPSTTAAPEPAITAADTTAPPSSTTTALATTSTSTAPSTTTSVVCGAGKASVSFTAKDMVTDLERSTFTPQATVDNQVSAAIEVEELVLEVLYPGEEVRTVRFATAGTVIPPGTSASFTAERLTTAKRYESVRFTRFTYFTEGQRQGCSVSTP